MYKNQIFKNIIPKIILFELLDKICLKKDNYYMIDQNSHKKMIFHNYNIEFCSTILNYYHFSKQYYVTRTFTYNSFINIVRQICKSNDINFHSKVRYNESEYETVYLIYF